MARYITKDIVRLDYNQTMPTLSSLFSVRSKLGASAGLVSVAVFLLVLAYSLSPSQFLALDTNAALAALTNSLVSVRPFPTPSLSSSPAAVLAESYIVTEVVDGDTIEVAPATASVTPGSDDVIRSVKVRLIGMDTPETVDPRKPVQCFGKEASARTKELLEGKVVTLVKDVSETDRYHRLLRYVYLDGVFINQQLVLEGYAHARSYPPDVKYQTEFRAAEQTAREKKRGFWADGACP